MAHGGSFVRKLCDLCYCTSLKVFFSWRFTYQSHGMKGYIIITNLLINYFVFYLYVLTEHHFHDVSKRCKKRKPVLCSVVKHTVNQQKINIK